MESILQAFLEVGLLEMVDEDEKLKHLQNTAQDLAEKPSKNRADVIKATLVALDAEVPSTEAELQRVESALKKHWKTIKAKSPDVPRQLLRSVLLESLHRRGQRDAKTAAIIWLTGCSFFPRRKQGREESLCNSFLLEMGRRAEVEANKRWVSSYEYSYAKIDEFDFNVDAKLPSLNSSALTKHLAAAAGPRNAEGEATEPDPNPHWPNAGQPWSQKFAPRAASGIVDVVNKSYAELLQIMSEALKTTGSSLSNHVESINVAIEATLNKVAEGAKITERRSDVLWWRQTLYSASLKLSYRDLHLSEAAVAMGYDLHTQIPEFYPHSLEFLLREAMRQLRAEQESRNSNKITLVEFCKQLKASTHAGTILQLLGSAGNETGRVPLLSVVKKSLAGDTLDSSQMADRIGITGKTEVSFEDLAVWMLRDIQAYSLATKKD